ncbi:MAG: AMP-binding protein [Desulfobacteraceae bacterium]|nr:AMP-binding protein [Desulfobacteraceae bacterium]
MDLNAPTAGPDPVNVAGHLRRTARSQPYKRAVVYPAGRDAYGRVTYAHLTFAQLERESARIANGLEAAGITRGVRTVLMVKPGPEFFLLSFALFKVGAVPVVVDPGMGLQRMLECLGESRPEAFVGISKAHLLRLFYPRFFRTLRTWVTVGPRWCWGGPTLLHLLRRPWQAYPPAGTIADEAAAILFTTGSTGPAKGVVYTHGVFDAQIRHIQAHFQIAPDEIDLPTFPLFALFDPALGMTAVIPDMDPTRPAAVNPVRILEAIENHGVTNMFASPALLNRVGRYGARRGLRLPSLRRVVSAGAPVLPDNIKRFAGMLCGEAEIHTPYGATEAVPVISIGSSEILSETRHLSEKGFGTCVGRPLEGLRVAIIEISDDPIGAWSDARVVPQGDIGEITVTGDLVTRHYFQRPEADALAKIADGEGFWHRMGDLGWMDTKGRVWFCGRKSQRVITPDETLFTIPCEAIFNRHPAVFRSALVGVGPRGQQTPVICIELEKTSRQADREALRRELLALACETPLTHKIETILFHPAFPVDIRHNSKIFREQLARWAERQVVSGPPGKTDAGDPDAP